MLFDRLCSISERHFTDLVPALRAASLVHLPNLMPEGDDLGPFRNLMVHDSLTFKLPSPVTAIELSSAVTVLVDSYQGQVGLGDARAFISCVPVKTGDAGLNRGIEEAIGKDAVMLMVGSVSKYQFDPAVLTQVRAVGKLYWWSLATKQELLQRPTKPPPDTLEGTGQDMVNHALKMAVCAIEALVYQTSPRFYLESRKPANVREGEKIARSGDREVLVSHPVTPDTVSVQVVA